MAPESSVCNSVRSCFHSNGLRRAGSGHCPCCCCSSSEMTAGVLVDAECRPVRNISTCQVEICSKLPSSATHIQELHSSPPVGRRRRDQS
jgi:hypothetical protein